MNEDIFLISVILSLLIITLFSIFCIITRMQKKRDTPKNTEESRVEFIVDTFHDLIAKLKDKERELETLRNRAEERADVMESYNEYILQSVPSGVVSLNSDGKITKINTAAERILGLSSDTVTGMGCEEVFTEPISGFLRDGSAIERRETQYTTKSGKNIRLGITVTPLYNAVNKIIGKLMVFTDITELKALESQAELRNRLSSLGEMAAGMAHELRNPMGVIAGYVKLLSKNTDPSMPHVLDAISREVAVMDRVITDFLFFARPTELTISRVDLAGLIKRCTENILGERDNIKVYYGTKEIQQINGDEILLRQAFSNLIQNAIDAMPNGGELHFELSSSPDSAYIAISDSGHGIPKNIMDKIFLPFYTTKDGGTGLGLAIVHKIIVSHKGSITVESRERGTAFRIRLPV